MRLLKKHKSYRAVICPISTTSNAEPLTLLIADNSSSFHLMSGTPVINQSLPLSATIIPYFLSALRITCTLRENPAASADVFACGSHCIRCQVENRTGARMPSFSVFVRICSVKLVKFPVVPVYYENMPIAF